MHRKLGSVDGRCGNIFLHILIDPQPLNVMKILLPIPCILRLNLTAVILCCLYITVCSYCLQDLCMCGGVGCGGIF